MKIQSILMMMISNISTWIRRKCVDGLKIRNIISNFNLDIKFNITAIMLLYYRCCCGTTSHIKKSRLIRDIVNYEEEKSYWDDVNGIYVERTPTDWSLLRRPMAFLRSIKKYHNCNWCTLLVMGSYLTMIAHFGIKALVYILWGSHSEERVVLLNSYYYGPMIYVMKPINRSCLVFGFTCLYNAIIRSVMIYKFVTSAIINEKRYKKIWPSQITIGYLSLYCTTVRGYLAMIALALKHNKRIKTYSDFYKSHCELVDPNDDSYKEAKGLSRMYQRYYVNMINSSPCSCELEAYFLNPKSGYRRDWHRPEPFHRCDLNQVHLLLLLIIFGGAIMFFAVSLAIYTLIYMHIALNICSLTNHEIDYHNGWWDHFTAYMTTYLISNSNTTQHNKGFPQGSQSSSLNKKVYSMPIDANCQHFDRKSLSSRTTTNNYHNHTNLMTHEDQLIPKYIPFTSISFCYIFNVWFERKRIILLVEDLLMVISMTFNYLETGLLIMNVVIFNSRAYKINDSLKFDLSQIRHNDEFIMDSINERLIYCCHNIGLLLDEIVDMQHEWGAILDILIISNVLILSCGLAIFASIAATFSEYSFLLLFIINSSAPLVLCLMSGSLVESGLKRVYFTINKLLVNEAEFLDIRTVKTLMKLNQRLKDENNRSLMLLGHLALTPVRAVSMLAWISSFVLLLNKFL